jgi:hypothetical protein
VFRQVVVYQWADDASPEAKEDLRRALDDLRAIPELLTMVCGDDAGHFDDNLDFVAVASIDNFEAARRYVVHPLHQAYIQNYASRVIGRRIIVQYDWDAPSS